MALKHKKISQLKIIIHKQKKELLRLSELEKLLETLLDLVAGIHWWKDKGGIYRGCNQAMVEQLRLASKNDIIGKSDYELPWKDQAALLIENDNQVMRENKTQQGKEEHVSTLDGKMQTFLVAKAPLYNAQGKVIGTVGNSIDITDRKKMEETLCAAKEAAEAANKAKTEFLENMRHDFRTPLVGITGCADAIRKDIDNPEKKEVVKEYADDLMISGHALSTLLNEVLDMAKMATGTPLVKKKFDLREKLTHIVDLNQSRAHQKHLMLILEQDEAIPHYLIGDPIRIQRMVLELVTNALNFTEKGYVKIATKLAQRNGKNIIIKISVTDTGIGIASDKQQEVFTRFKRLTPSYEGVYQGAGLGLALVKQFADDLDGELYLDSEPQKGSTFTCILPLKKALLDEPFGTDSTVSEANISSFKNNNDALSQDSKRELTKILLVEDNAIAAKVAASLLEELNCEIDTAINAKIAIEYATTIEYDLIFLDIGLPDKSGNEVAEEIREWEEKQQHPPIPIIALTAHIDTENKEKCLKAGINTVVPKPLSKEKGLEILKAFIAKRRVSK